MCYVRNSVTPECGVVEWNKRPEKKGCLVTERRWGYWQKVKRFSTWSTFRHPSLLSSTNVSSSGITGVICLSNEWLTALPLPFVFHVKGLPAKMVKINSGFRGLLFLAAPSTNHPDNDLENNVDQPQEKWNQRTLLILWFLRQSPISNRFICRNPHWDRPEHTKQDGNRVNPGLHYRLDFCAEYSDVFQHSSQ